MTLHSDITLIGGGIIGLLTAREFAAAGKAVTVIDQGLIGKESSWAGGGIILPLYPWRQSPAITALVKPSFELYPTLAAELLAATGIDPEWYPCGMLITQNPDVEAARQWCKSHGINYETADPSRFHNLNTRLLNPLWLPNIAQIRNPRLIKALTQDLRQQGVQLIENCQLNRINIEKDRISSIDTNQGILAINELIISAGAWTSKLMAQFLPEYNIAPIYISPVRGQMLLYQAQPDTLKSMVLDGDHYLIPRRDGHILAGSTVENATAFDKTTTQAGKTELHNFALRLLPALKTYPLVKHWAGLRPGTSDGVPYIDKHPQLANLSINAGHFRNGLAMAPASAKLMADLILNRPPTIDPEPYRLHRS